MEQPPPPENDYPPQATPVYPAPTRDERTWALLSHILPLPAISVVFVGHILVPLLIWLLKREESAFVADQAKEALNFQISYSLYSILAGLLILACVGWILLPVLGVAWVILAVVATFQANQGIAYRYPLTIRFIR